jgi:peroxiredoxin
MDGLQIGAPVPRDLAAATLVAADGKDVVLGTFWATGPAVLVFLRHFGCVGCSEIVTELAPRLDELARARVRTVLVGNGSPAQRNAFVDRHALAGAKVEVLVDPTLAAYRAAGLARSAFATYGPRAIWETLRAMGNGHPHRPPEGDPTQQGGALVVGDDQRLLFYKRSRSIGDHAPASDLVDAALRLVVMKQAVLV